jgi:heme-degrading monooxygenase HmoA
MHATFTVFRYEPSARLWALKQMGVAPQRLANVEGLSFSMLMGSGRGLVFSLLPDWSRYVLLAVWRSEEAAAEFLAHSSVMQSFRRHAQETWTVHMRTLKAHGLWKGQNPFQPISSIPGEQSPIVVLTRASIRVRALWDFWKNAPLSAKALEGADGLLFSCGVGELPFTRQATISIWENETAMKAFAYGTRQHTDVMRRKQRQEWYWEELFARFVPVRTEGSYLGGNPLGSRLLFRSDHQEQHRFE